MNEPNSRDGLPLPTQSPPPKPDDGGQAFPGQAVFSPECGTLPGWLGMSLRDWFAGQATEKDIEVWQLEANRAGRMVSREQAKYLYADAMLQARSR